MPKYVGIDAHKDSCTLAIMGPSGRRLAERCVETTSTALRAALREVAGERQICLEEGEYSEWLYEICEPLAKRVVVVQPEKSEGSKSDAMDAWKRADELRRGVLTQVIYKPAGEYRELREAVRAYSAVVGDLVRVKNRLRAVYRSRGVRAVAAELYSSIKRTKWLDHLPEAVRQRASLLGIELDHLADVHEQAQRWLLEAGSRVPAVTLLATAPGIGRIRAAMIAAYVVTPSRFRTSRQFWSYCGLAVVMRSSSDWVKDSSKGWVRKDVAQTRGLNRNRQPLLKAVFKGAAVTVIRQSPDSPLGKHYARMLDTTKPNLARLTIARRIAATTLAMWKTWEVYDPDKQDRS